jgi:hypothetical protein
VNLICNHGENLTLFTGIQIFRRCIGTHNSVPSFTTGCHGAASRLQSRRHVPIAASFVIPSPLRWKFFFAVSPFHGDGCVLCGGSEQSMLGQIRRMHGGLVGLDQPTSSGAHLFSSLYSPNSLIDSSK